MRFCALVLTLTLTAGATWAQEDAAQQFDLAMRHHNGTGVLQDYATAAMHLQTAAEHGFAPAQNMLGRYYFEGLGVPQNRAEAMRWFEAAADSGDPVHLFDLAQMLEADPATATRAAQMYGRAAAAGLADASVSLGVLYQEGRGVPQDYARAHALYEGPAADGHARALNNLGLLYVRANGVTQDYARAATLFAAAAEQGLPQAMTNLGVLYENGFGVPLDEARAAELYRAAGQGAPAPPDYVYDPRLAALPGGTDTDALRAAAMAGDPVAQFQWSWLILSAPESAVADRMDAAHMLRRTAAQGHGPSMLNLGLLHMRGIGVSQDYVLGHMWMLLAQARDVSGATAAIDATRAKLTASQINEAQQRAKAYTQN